MKQHIATLRALLGTASLTEKETHALKQVLEVAEAAYGYIGAKSTPQIDAALLRLFNVIWNAEP